MSLVGLKTGCTNYSDLMRLQFLTSQFKYEDSRFVLHRFLVSNLAFAIRYLECEVHCATSSDL